VSTDRCEVNILVKGATCTHYDPVALLHTKPTQRPADVAADVADVRQVAVQSAG
jgi:hypothetical protein